MLGVARASMLASAARGASWAQLFTAMGNPPGLAYDMTDASKLRASRTTGDFGVASSDPIGYVLDVSRGAIDAAGPGVHAAATSDARRPVYGSFDGGAAMAAQFPATAGNSLQTVTTLDLTSTDEVHVFAAVRGLSDGANRVIVEAAADWTIATGTFFMYRTSANQYQATSRGTSNALASSGAYPQPDASLLYLRAKISTDTLRLWRNGTQVATNTADQGSGNFGNHLINIGARNAGSPTLPLNGRIARLAIIGGPMTAEQIAVATALTGAGLTFSP